MSGPLFTMKAVRQPTNEHFKNGPVDRYYQMALPLLLQRLTGSWVEGISRNSTAWPGKAGRH